MENTFHAFLTLKGKRLTGSFGSMHGLKIDKAVPDEISKDDLPYMEMIYRFVLVRKILLRLIFNKTRRATSYERGGVRRRKRPTDTTDRVTERLAIRQKVEVRTVSVRGPQYAPTATKLYKQAYSVAIGLVRGSTLRQ